METEINQPPQKSWPPTFGWPLFLAWMGGVLVASVVTTGIAAADQSGNAPMGWTIRILFVVLGLLVRGWESWLLFSKRPARFALWTCLALVTLAFWQNYGVYQYISLVIPLVEAAILAGTRQRTWAWILAGMAGVVIHSALNGIMIPSGSSRLLNWVNTIMSGTGSPSWLGLILMTGVHRGVWLLTEVLKAWVLAWKMPVRPAGPSPA